VYVYYAFLGQSVFSSVFNYGKKRGGENELLLLIAWERFIFYQISITLAHQSDIP